MIPFPGDPRCLVAETCPCRGCGNLAIMVFGDADGHLVNGQAHCKAMPEIRLRWNRKGQNLDLMGMGMGIRQCSGFIHKDAHGKIDQAVHEALCETDLSRKIEQATRSAITRQISG